MFNRLLIAILFLYPIRAEAFFPSVAYDADVAAIVSEVSQTTLTGYLNGLTGQAQITVGGINYTLSSRATNSGTQITRATQWVYEHCAANGWTASYENWSDGGYSSRNVICTKTGTTYSTPEVVLCGHIDSFWPGADDNGSGTALLMHLVEILGDKDFKRTIKIVFFTGEEEGLYGSTAYVYDLVVEPYAMIAYDTLGYDGTTDSRFTIGTGSSGVHAANANDTAIGVMFQNALSEYSISGTAVIDSTLQTTEQTDIWPIWNTGSSVNGAVQVDEDLTDITPYYHSANDTVANLDMAQVVNITKAAVVVTANIAEYEPETTHSAKTGSGGMAISTGTMSLQ